MWRKDSCPHKVYILDSKDLYRKIANYAKGSKKRWNDVLENDRVQCSQENILSSDSWAVVMTRKLPSIWKLEHENST